MNQIHHLTCSLSHKLKLLEKINTDLLQTSLDHDDRKSLMELHAKIQDEMTQLIKAINLEKFNCHDIFFK